MSNAGRIRPDSVRLKDAGNVVPIRDNLVNLLTGMGTTTDARSYGRYVSRYMSDFEIDQSYRGSWVIRKAIDKPATEMVREWRDWQAESGDIELLEAEEKRLDIRNKVKRAEILRGLGGAGMVLYVPDADQMQPLDPKRIRTGDLKHVHVWHRSRFSLGEIIGDWGSEWFGHPEYYEVSLQGVAGATPIKFHPSRVVAFKADHVGDIVGAGQIDWFWGQSKVQTILSAAMNVDTAENGFASLIKDARNRRIYIPGLLDMTATEQGKAILAARLQAFALGESSNSVSWLDAGSVDQNGKLVNAEKIEDRQMVWAGMPDIMNAYRTAMAAAADMPVTVLWGTSPAGLNATGQSDLDLYDKMIRGRQDLDLRPCMTQIDAALVPSALGRVDDNVWYEWAPLSSQSEKDEATTLWNTMQGLAILKDMALLPDIALSKGVQNLISERGWIPGLDDALSEIPENERFPELEQPGAAPEPDPNALVASGGQQQPKGGDRPSAGGSAPALHRAANDALKAKGIDDAVIAQVLDAAFADATPRTLYVSRKVQNVADITTWAKAQGIADLNDDLHVTIAYSTTPVDWIKMGTTWQGDDKGNMTIAPGGPRVVEPLGDQSAVLMFASSDLGWRNREMREAGASWDWPDYQPHISLTKAPVDLSKVRPYTGTIVLGPEIFEEIRKGDDAE